VFLLPRPHLCHCDLHDASDKFCRQNAAISWLESRGRHGRPLRTPRPAHDTDPTGPQCGGDPVGRPAGPWRAGGGRVGMMRSHDDRIDPHPALRAGLSLPGRGVFSLPCNCMCKPSLRRTKPRRLLSLALARARERMKGEGVGRTSTHDATDPHPALRAGLSLPGRGVSSLPCNCDVQTVTSVAPSHVDSSPSPWPGRGRG